MAGQKEALLNLLRSYHETPFKEVAPEHRTYVLMQDFVILEDEITNMAINISNGKAGIPEQLPDLDAFRVKAQALSVKSPEEINEKDIFVAKIAQLAEIIEAAKSYPFKQRRQSKKEKAKV